MKYITPFLVCMLFCQCGDLSDKCIQIQQVNLCYYPDDVTTDEANTCAIILAEQGLGQIVNW